MKRISALLLIAVLLYQAGGFALQFLQQKSSNISASEFLSSDKVVVKVPISLPYSQNWEEGKKVSGQVQKGDEFYDMVEQKMEGDTLYTTLVTNHSAREQFIEFSAMVEKHLSTDPSKQQQSKSNLISLLIKEYCDARHVVVLYLLDWSITTSNFSTPVYVTSGYSSDLLAPPRQV